MNNKEISKVYEAEKYEDSIYKIWEESGFFNPDNLAKEYKEPFTISLPPPNATGVLHVGHAVMLAIQDLVIRFQRMREKKTLWLPGTDHAAIATQTVVEKQLAKEGKTKYDLGREKFIEKVKKYVAESQGTIHRQMRKMGVSCDWSRERYTLDEGLSRAVTEAFVRMYNDGLIYRGYRIVNWCPRCKSTLADDEVEYQEEKAPFYYFKYGPIIIGTARPETKFGDKVIIVHPMDERYKDLVGKEFDVEWILGKINARVIADEVADRELGSGAMTITPGHSWVDFELAQKYNISIEKIIDEDGKLTEAAGEFKGMPVKEARAKVIQILQNKGLVDHIDENYVHNLSVCYRCGTPIEPLPSKQWFINVNKPIKKFGGKSLKEKAIEVVKTSEIKIIPERFEKIYFHWLENLRDWCISRQIWFGHRIPVWYRGASRQNQELGIRNQEFKTWNLKIYGEDIFNALRNGTKTIEVRAGRKKGTGKDWSEFRPGDIIEFNLADEKADQLIASIAPVKKVVKAVKHFKDIEEMLQDYSAADDYPGKSVTELKKWWESRSLLFDRIKKYGVWVFELTENKLQPTSYNLQAQEVYVGATPPKGENWQQDPDTLDTWFSSGLWTFSTLGWPKQTKDLKTFHPTSLMETGYDILFFWVARMIIMSTYLMGEIPFKTVYLHGIIRDINGEKMSKSKPETCIDPVDMIGKYGGDAMRLSLVIGNTAGNDSRLYEEKIAGFRNFVNKLWNISRYILLTVKKSKLIEKPPKPKTLADKWILAELNKLIDFATENLERYNFSMVGERIYEFTWSKLADWYVEISKIPSARPLRPRAQGREVRAGKSQNSKIMEEILLYVLQNLLKLWHPFTPFVTEVIWHKINGKGLLMVQPWPKAQSKIDKAAIKNFDLIKDIVTAIRNLRSEGKILPAKKINAVIIAGKFRELIGDEQEIIKNLARVEKLSILTKGKGPAKSYSAVVSNIEIYLPVSGMIDIGKEVERLKKEVQRIEDFIIHLEEKLKNQRFLERAPAEIIEAEKEKLKSNKEMLEKIKQQLKSLK